jgi:hypothetical protein
MRIVFGAKKTLKTWRVAAERGFGFVRLLRSKIRIPWKDNNAHRQSFFPLLMVVDLLPSGYTSRE